MLELIGILIFLGLVGFSIGLHELGHFIPARKFGVKVTEFAIGFGPTIFAKNLGETSFRIRALPVGGFIRMIGMYLTSRNDGKADTGFFSGAISQAREESAREITPREEDRVFYKLSVPKRLIIMSGGPFMNFVLATIMFTFVLSVIGFQIPTTQVGQVIHCVPTATNPEGTLVNGTCKDSKPTPSSQMKLKVGDKVLRIGDKQITEWSDFSKALQKYKVGDKVSFVILRNGEKLFLSAKLAALKFEKYDSDGQLTGEYGVRPFVGVAPDFVWTSKPISEVPSYMWQFTKSSIQSLMEFPTRIADLTYRLATGKERDPNGPISVVGVTRLSGEIAASDQTLRSKAQQILGMAASLNLFLFLFNLLPFLPLDGGHAAGALFEATRRRFAKLRGQDDARPVDIARMLPLTYLVSFLLLGAGLIVIVADAVAPITLNS